jgi:hypothetical protein
MSRQTDYTEELADSICTKLAEGLSLRQICNDDSMPHRITVIRWMGKDEAFATKCARARAEQADLMDDRILEIANKLEAGEMAPDVARVALSALQWRASKLQPKKYGDKQHVEHSGVIALESLVNASMPATE